MLERLLVSKTILYSVIKNLSLTTYKLKFVIESRFDYKPNSVSSSFYICYAVEDLSEAVDRIIGDILKYDMLLSLKTGYIMVTLGILDENNIVSYDFSYILYDYTYYENLSKKLD